MKGSDFLDKIEFIDNGIVEESASIQPPHKNHFDRHLLLKVSFSFALILVLVLGIPMLIRYLDNKNTNNVDWVDHYKTIDEMAVSSDYIILAKVTNQKTEVRHDLVFTLSQVTIIKNFKSPLNSEILPVIILQTGGKNGELITRPISDVLMLKSSGNYLLFLKKSDEGTSLIMGGFQGAASIIDGKVSFPNNHAFTENQLNHLSVDDLESAIASLTIK